jgi:hypothetical protein
MFFVDMRLRWTRLTRLLHQIFGRAFLREFLPTLEVIEHDERSVANVDFL